MEEVVDDIEGNFDSLLHQITVHCCSPFPSSSRATSVKYVADEVISSPNGRSAA